MISKKEMLFQKDLDSKTMISLYRILEKEAKKLYIIMEYCENGDMA